MEATAIVLCNNLLIRAKEDGIPVIPMKLQRLLYYVCAKYVHINFKSAISEHFEVWKYGPCIPSVYAVFGSYADNPIERLFYDARGTAEIVDEDSNPELKECLDFAWNKFKYFPAIELAKMACQKGSGWYAAFQRNDKIISLLDIIYDQTV